MPALWLLPSRRLIRGENNLASSGDISTITEILLYHGADVNLQLENGRYRNVLDAALNTGDEGTIRTILVAGGDVRYASNRIELPVTVSFRRFF